MKKTVKSVVMRPSENFAGFYKLENDNTFYRRVRCGSGSLYDKTKATRTSAAQQPNRVVVQCFRSGGSVMERFADGSILETDFVGVRFLYTPVKRPKLPKKIRRRWKHRLVLHMIGVDRCYLAGRKFSDYRGALEWGKLIVGDKEIPWEYKGSNAKIHRHKWMTKYYHLVPKTHSRRSEMDRLLYGKQKTYQQCRLVQIKKTEEK